MKTVEGEEALNYLERGFTDDLIKRKKWICTYSSSFYHDFLKKKDDIELAFVKRVCYLANEENFTYFDRFKK